MPVVNGYVSRTELRDWISFPAGGVEDAKLDRAINAASRSIDDFCGRAFWTTAGPRVFDTFDKRSVLIHDAVSISAVKTDDNADGTFETVWAVTDWQASPYRSQWTGRVRPFNKIRAVAGRTFPEPLATGREGLVEVTGVWGWPSIPDDVVMACKIMATRLVKRKDSPEGVSGSDEFGMIRISGRDDPDAVRLLAPFRLVGVA